MHSWSNEALLGKLILVVMPLENRQEEYQEISLLYQSHIIIHYQKTEEN